MEQQSSCIWLLSLHSRAQELQLLSLCAAATEAYAPRACAPQQNKPLQWEARALQQSSAHLQQLEKAHTKQERPSTAKIKQTHK